MKRWILAAAALTLLAACERPDPGARAVDRCQSVGESAAVITACTEVIEDQAQPEALRASAFLNRAYAKRNAGDITGALRDFEAALALRTSAPGLIGRGQILLESGQLDAAQPLLEQAAGDDETGQAELLLGRIALLQSDYAAAVTRFDAALARDARLAPALAGRARARQRLDNAEGARADYDAAIRIDGELAEARAGRCWLTVLEEGDLGQARTDARAAVTADAALVEGQMCRGIVALRDGEWEDARTAFDAVLAIEPGNPTALFGRGIARRRSGDRTGTADMNLARDFDRNIGGRFDDMGVRTY